MRAGTKLIETRPPTEAEHEAHGGEVVFIRRDAQGRERKVFAGRCYESWQQWGESTDVLWDNVPDVEAWRAEQPDEQDEDQ